MCVSRRNLNAQQECCAPVSLKEGMLSMQAEVSHFLSLEYFRNGRQESYNCLFVNIYRNMVWCSGDLRPDDIWDPFAGWQELTFGSCLMTSIGILCMCIAPI